MKNKLALLGFFILVISLYRRLFKERLPKEILPTDDIIIVSINICVCIAMFFLICINIVTLINFFSNKENSEPSKTVYFSKLKEILKNTKNPLFIITESLIAFDIFIKNLINFDYLDKSITFITNYFNTYKKFFLYLFISIVLIVQSIICISFFVDVFFMKKFYYFYRTLWLLIFPLIINYLFYSIKAFIDTNFTSLEDVLILKITKTSDYLVNKNEKDFITITVNEWRNISKNAPANTIICHNSLSPDYLKTRPFLDKEKTLIYCINSLNDFLVIDSFLDQYNLLKNKIILPYNIFKYVLYFIGWCYILYIIL